MFLLYANKNQLALCQREPLTSGSVNVYRVRFEFSDDWEGLEKTAVFRCGGRSSSVLLDESGACTIPREVLSAGGRRLETGVHGARGGEAVLPTVWASLGVVLTGVTAEGPSESPDEPGPQEPGPDEPGPQDPPEDAGAAGPAGPGGNPIGTVISFMGRTAPKDYLACDGAEYPIAEYPDLSTFFAQQFGKSSHFGGNGETTFAVPDMRNLFLRGYHGEAEEQLSGEVGQLQEATEFPNILFNGNSRGVGAWNNGIAVKIEHADKFSGSSTRAMRYVLANETNPNDLASPSLTARPINMAVLYCIKAV